MTTANLTIREHLEGLADALERALPTIEGVDFSTTLNEDGDAIVVQAAYLGNEVHGSDLWAAVNEAAKLVGLEFADESGPVGGPFVDGGTTYIGGEYAWYRVAKADDAAA